MAILDEICGRIARGQFEFSQHAVDQSIMHHINNHKYGALGPLPAGVRAVPNSTRGGMYNVPKKLDRCLVVLSISSFKDGAWGCSPRPAGLIRSPIQTSAIHC